MTLLFSLLVVLADGMVSIPPATWQAIDVAVPQHGMTIDCTFRVVEGSRVQALLVTREQARRFHHGRFIQPLYSSGFEDYGRFRHRAVEAGDYVLLLDNHIDRRQSALVQVRIELLKPHVENITTLPAHRRRAVVALSLLFFGSVVLFSARQYLKQQ